MYLTVRSLVFITSLIVISVFVGLFYNMETSWKYVVVYANNIRFQKDSSSMSTNSGNSKLSYGGCQLVKRNSWEESILDVFDPLYGYQEQCTKTKLRTNLKDGQLVNVEEKDYCRGRCLNRASSSGYSNGNWQNATETFKCDIIEARCSKTPKIEDYDYIWVHTQIHENAELKKKEQPSSNHTYDIFLLVLDSTSYTQSNRNLPKTLNYLKNGLNGVEFPFLNRVAKNSKPNAATLFTGEIAEEVDRDVIGEPSLKPTINMYSFASSATLQAEYAKHGYVTAFYEDYTEDVFDFKQSIATHENIPFRRFWWEQPEKMKEMKKKNTCTSDHQIIFAHTAQFLDSYKGIPKFTTLWDSNFGHDTISSSIIADTIIYDFLIKNRKSVVFRNIILKTFKLQLENSFIIVMGDHGLKIQIGKTTKLGRYEINNPMLIVVPPKDLRSNIELMETLKENSEKLQTHHDTSQTLLDILKYQPSVSFSDREPLDTNLRGSSYLRKQIGERNCLTLPIPFQYCICNQEYEDIDRNSSTAIKVGEFVASEINNQLKTFGIANKCNIWKFKKLNVLHKLKNIIHMDVYEVEGAYEPDAVFTTMVGDFLNGTMRMGAADRTDMFRDRGQCIDDPSKWPICDCIKKQE